MSAGKMTSDEFANAVIELFERYSEYFGVNSQDFPHLMPEWKQVEYEIEFNRLICELRGHDFILGQDGPAEFCDRCRKLKSDIVKV